VVFAAVAYLVAGIVFGHLAKSAGAGQMRITWRWAAWLVSAVVFGIHLWYEHFRLRDRPIRAARDVSIAVALGAFGLAAAANVHALESGAPHRLGVTLALVIWPLLAGLPAFVVALVCVLVLARMRPANRE
jgi:tellurite resistance protein TehA-like permease